MNWTASKQTVRMEKKRSRYEKLKKEPFMVCYTRVLRNLLSNGIVQSSLISRTRGRRFTRNIFLAVFFIIVVFIVRQQRLHRSRFEFNYAPIPIRPERYPLSSLIHLPKGRAKKLPKIQHEPIPETSREKETREGRLQEGRDAFLHSWNGYKEEAWGQDELKPITGGYKTPFCGWAATMVDSLDTLWIMGLREEFERSLVELRNIDFTNTEGCQINLFETTIRHLGGFLSAFDISGGTYYILIEKAVELAEVLYTAFDTPNRMPSPHFTWSA